MRIIDSDFTTSTIIAFLCFAVSFTLAYILIMREERKTNYLLNYDFIKLLQDGTTQSLIKQEQPKDRKLSHIYMEEDRDNCNILRRYTSYEFKFLEACEVLDNTQNSEDNINEIILAVPESIYPLLKTSKYVANMSNNNASPFKCFSYKLDVDTLKSVNKGDEKYFDNLSEQVSNIAFLLEIDGEYVKPDTISNPLLKQAYIEALGGVDNE